MKRWVQVLLFVLLLGMLMQCALYYNSHYPQLVLPSPQTAFTSTVDPARHSNATAEVDPCPYPFQINQPDACARATELVIVVVTAVKNFEDRQAVRETWGSYATNSSHNTTLVFLLGTTSSADLQAKLKNESRRYRDIVQGGFVDSYRNLSIKSVALLKWVSLYCNTSRFVLKADDDMYVNVPNLISALRAEKKTVFVMGHTFTGARPVQNKNSKWYTPLEDFNEKVYPRYTSGTAYSMSTKAAFLLWEAAKKVRLFWLEDIYITGLCARKAGVSLVHHGGFNYAKLNPDGCSYRKAITGHRNTAEEKRKIHKEVYDPKLVCK
ncbi:hypothetical protein BaRGS_00013133 [Batillaria attramentaria]|uniref:Hexosyltransferase n=1 Tax=Batillaria attramentaria TaxID=370345 RepID=A0ABD0L809_9CAEN